MRQKIPKIRSFDMPVTAYYSSLASPDSETQANSVVLVTHSATEDLLRLEEMKISARLLSI